MDFDSSTNTDLIGPKIRKTVHHVLKKDTHNGGIISEKITLFVSQFYYDYISPNKLATFILILIIAFLIHRYYSKKKKFESFNYDADNSLSQEIASQTNHLKFDTQPSFNKLLSLKGQEQPVYYPPDPLPINLPDKGIVYKRDIYNNPYNTSNNFLNSPNYDHNNVYKYPNRDYHTGTYDTYKNSSDTDIPNPYGYPNDFNTSTADFIKQMVNSNKNNLSVYQSLIDNMNSGLKDQMKYGPQYLNPDLPEYTMEPPFSDDV